MNRNKQEKPKRPKLAAAIKKYKTAHGLAVAAGVSGSRISNCLNGSVMGIAVAKAIAKVAPRYKWHQYADECWDSSKGE